MKKQLKKRAEKMNKKITDTRKLIEKSIINDNKINKLLLKNNFTRIAPLLKEKSNDMFEKLMGFECMELTRKELIDFKIEINNLRFPNLINKAQNIIFEKEFNRVTFLLTDAMIETNFWSSLLLKKQFDFYMSELPKEKQFDMYYLHRNINQEKRVRKAMRVLIKYSNRELDSLINKKTEM